MNQRGKILTTHVGALPAPADLLDHPGDNPERLREEVANVVKQQRSLGVDLVNEGEMTKGGNWVTFVNDRLEGFERRKFDVANDLMARGADQIEFADFYAAALAGGTLFEQTRSAPKQTEFFAQACVGPIKYRGQALLKREIDTLLAALGDVPPAQAFLTSTAPASLEPGRANEYYKTPEEYVFALADAMSVEYEMIADAGLTVQVDDAWLMALWGVIGIPMGLEAYRSYCTMRVEALNHALRNVSPEKVRYHLCWGSWHGPHAHDLPLPDIVDILLKVNAQTYLIEAANVRHEHEVSVWEKVKLPEGKKLAPGVVSHATALIEHPDLVSHRIQSFAALVGRDNVIASTDCGLGLRCHPQIAWAKLRVLCEGAQLATKALWA